MDFADAWEDVPKNYYDGKNSDIKDCRYVGKDKSHLDITLGHFAPILYLSRIFFE